MPGKSRAIEELEHVVKVNSQTNAGPIPADLHVRNPVAVRHAESH